MSLTDIDQLIKAQQDTNRLLKLLIRATLTNPPNPLVSKPNFKIIKDNQFTTAQLTIQPGASLTVLDLPEKPDTDVNVMLVAAETSINSNKVRISAVSSSKVGKSNPFNFNATQQELGVAGFTSPNNFPLWTPIAAGAAGIFTVLFSGGFLLSSVFHNRMQIIFKNEDTVAATIQSNGLFIAVYEYDQATMDLFAEVLTDTDPATGVSLTDTTRRLRDIPP